MSLLKLQIRQYSEHSDLINIVSCAVNKVSVFRAKNPFYLDEYAKLLAGVDTQGRYSVQLDGKPYSIPDDMLVGFPGRGVASTDLTVREVLEAGGVLPSVARKLLGNFGLPSVADSLLRNLPSCEKRRIEILVALFHSEHRVAVFHDPFIPLSYDWRDTFAELTAAFATENAKIVVITGLSQRPESWLDNPQIVRIEVDKVHRRTVGFSGDEGNMDSLVHELRESLATEGGEPNSEEEVYVPPAPRPIGVSSGSEVATMRMPIIDPFSPLGTSASASGSWQNQVWLRDLRDGMGSISFGLKRISSRTAPTRAGTWVGVGMLLSLATLVFVLVPGGAPKREGVGYEVPGAEPVSARPYENDHRVLDAYPGRIRESVLAAYLEIPQGDSQPKKLKSSAAEPHRVRGRRSDIAQGNLDLAPLKDSTGALDVELPDLD